MTVEAEEEEDPINKGNRRIFDLINKDIKLKKRYKSIKQDKNIFNNIDKGQKRITILSTKTEEQKEEGDFINKDRECRRRERFHIQRQNRPKKQEDDSINKEKGGRFYQQRQKIKTRQFHQQRYRKLMTTQN